MLANKQNKTDYVLFLFFFFLDFVFTRIGLQIIAFEMVISVLLPIHSKSKNLREVEGRFPIENVEFLKSKTANDHFLVNLICNSK